MIRVFRIMHRPLLSGILFGISLASASPAVASPVSSGPSQAYGVAISIVAGDKKTGRPDDAGWITVTLSNVSGQDLSVVYTPSTIRLSFDVQDASGRHIGRRLYPATADRVRTSAYFPAGRTAVILARLTDWSSLKHPGTYFVRAIYRIAIMGDIYREVEIVSRQIAVTVPDVRD